MSDDSTLALRLGDAADLLEEISAHYGYPNPELIPWAADELRHEAKELSK